MTEKTCGRCKVTKTIAGFYRDMKRSDGFRSACKSCEIQKSRAYVAANHEAMRARYRAYRQRNREADRARSRAYRAANLDEVMARIMDWRLAHPEYTRVRDSNRRAQRAGTHGRLTLVRWKQILLFYGNACAQCRASGSAEVLTVDHFIPTSRGGENTWRNIWPLCLPCNLKKGITVPAEPYPPHVAVVSLAETATLGA